MSRSARRSGFTLLELMVAVGVMLIAVAAATTLLMTALRMTRDAQGNIDAGERARLAATEMLDNLGRAGMGVWGGVRVGQAGAAVLTMPIFGADGTTGNGGTPLVPSPTGTDDLWLVAPPRTALGEACSVQPGDLGAKVPLTAATATGGAGLPVNVPCTTGLTSFSFLMVAAICKPTGSNCGLGSLMSGLTFSGTSVDFAEKSFNNEAPFNSFGVGDELMGVQLIHYFIAPNPADSNHPALFRGAGVLTNDDGRGRPFTDAALPGPMAEIPDVEDLQIAYATDSTATPTNDPALYLWQNGLSNVYDTTKTLKAMRVTLVGRSHQQVFRDSGGVASGGRLVSASSLPLIVENHTPSPMVADGWDRVQFTRRIELPNMSPTNL